MLLAACGPVAAPPAPTLAPTSAAPTAEARFAPGSRIATVDVGGLTADEAASKVRAALAPLSTPLLVQAGREDVELSPEALALRLPLDDLLNQAQSQLSGAQAVELPLTLEYNQQALRSQLESLASQIASTSSGISIITSTESISRSFAYRPGLSLDVDAAMQTVDAALRAVGQPRQVELELTESTPAAEVDLDAVAEQARQMAEEWNGVVGFYLYDLKSGETVGINENTVFSGASVMKVPILLYAYSTVEEFSARQQEAISAMIDDSDNLEANRVLAAGVGGASTEEALDGALEMTAMLRELGLKHTYQYMPYESGDWLIGVRGFTIQQGPEQEGQPPFTEADPTIRTTPAEIARTFVWLEQCNQNQGELLQRPDTRLTAARCGEILGHLEQNTDRLRLPAGLPTGTRIAHKSGWTEDMQADVGLVRSPGGDFVLAVYIYREGGDMVRDNEAGPVIAAFSRMVYTAYNPVRNP